LLRFAWLEADEETGQGALARDPKLALVEAVLFAADEPLTPRRLASLAGLADATEARRLVTRLRDLLAADETAFQVEELAGGFQLLTRSEFHPWLSRIVQARSEGTLSPAARETLAIIAYRQPITRADIEAVRGVGCSEVLRQLMDRGLVRISGRDDSLGRPQLYGTTRRFLQLFGLRSLRDLPPADGLQPPRSRAREEKDDE
jgi:segregation and condensation protein B